MVVSRTRLAAVTMMATGLLAAPVSAAGVARADASGTSAFLSQEAAPVANSRASIASSTYRLLQASASGEKTTLRARFTPKKFSAAGADLSIEGLYKDVAVTLPDGKVITGPDEAGYVTLDSVKTQKGCRKLEIVRNRTGYDGPTSLKETLKLSVEDRQGGKDKGPLCDIAKQFTDGDITGAATALNTIVDFQ
jgi:hypothetical protein